MCLYYIIRQGICCDICPVCIPDIYKDHPIELIAAEKYRWALDPIYLY